MNGNITAKWLAERYEDKIMANMNIPVKEMRQTVHKEYRANISKVQAYKAKVIALDNIKRYAAD